MLRSFVLLLALSCSAFSAGEPVAAGKYDGKWEGSSGAAGDFHMVLANADGKWSADVTFTLGGQDVKCTVKSISVENSRLHVVYTFDLQATPLESTIDGAASGQQIGGKYTTRAVSDGSAVDEGTWETTSSN